ncbi:MAG: serpin family protein [Myxococcales bacterium]|nr:serpin family protein [Myxococcales bacterium]MCB9708951.1 serpin family protein [Myxococcales bacterium]
MIRTCIVYLLAGVSFALGCGSGTEGRVPKGAQVAASDKARLTVDELPDARVHELAEGNAEFAGDLYAELLDDDRNLFFSPHSISTALAMAYAGARNNTAAQMKSTLHFELNDAEIHPSFNALDQELATRGKNAQGKDGEPFRLHIVNQAWGQRDFVFRPDYLDTLAAHYGAGLYLLDFASNAEESRLAINDWVADMTEDRISDLLAPGIITPATQLVLTNAVYFNAAWATPFRQEQTLSEDFTTLAGDVVEVPMMHQTEALRYAESDAWQAVELPYDGDELAMLVLLPKEDAFPQIEQDVSAHLREAIDGLAGHTVNVAMPRFKFTLQARLREPLMALGMTDAFGAADFSGMSDMGGFAIQDVVHQAFVSVDEAGTEAAAATAVIMWRVSFPIADKELLLNRPFIFAIRDNATGAILFLGRVTNPAQE